MDADGRNAGPLTVLLHQGAVLGWFPDSQHLAFTLLQGNKSYLAAVDIAFGRKERLREEMHQREFPRLSHDGTQIAFNSHEGGVINIWTASVQGAGAKQLTFDKEMMGLPCWSSDGKTLAIEIKRGDDTNVGIIPSGGGTPVQLTSDHGQSFPNDWSPDGHKIVFAGLRDGVWNIWWVSVHDKTEQQLTHHTESNSYVRYPIWSPRGDEIVYQLPDATGNVYIMHVKH